MAKAKKAAAKSKGKKSVKKPAKKTVKKTLKKSAVKKPAAKKAAPVVKKAQKPAVTPALRKSPKSLTQLISPLDDRILVQPIPAETTTPGGLILIQNADVSGNLKGQVLAVGRGHRNKKGQIRPVALQIGDEILFTNYAGSKISWNGQELILLRETDVLGIVET